MTTISRISIIILMFLGLFPRANAEKNDQISGKWTGKFMDQFDLELLLKVNESNQFTGIIRLFDGDQQIQDDPLADIKISGNLIFFTIPSKKTDFEGIYRVDQKVIEGNFIFPDQSRHPLRVRKSENFSDQTTDKASKELDALDRKFRGSQLKEDLAYLKENLEISHPQLYRFTDKETFNQLFSNVEHELEGGSTDLEFYRSVAPLIEKIKCSHTGIRPSPESREYYRNLGHSLPLQVYFSGEQGYCLDVYLPSEIIPAGSVLLSINGKNLDEIRKTIFTWLPAEANKVSAKYFAINQHFTEYFQILDNSESFDVVYQSPSTGEILNVRIPGQSMSEIEQDSGYQKRFSVPEAVSFSLRDDLNVAILKIGSFAIPDLNNYLNEMDQVFSRIEQQNTKNLILDLRGNQGGHPFFAAVLLSYLSQDPFIYFDDTDKVDEFGPLYEYMPPSEKSFRGNCFVLVDGGVMSTTGHLVSLIKFHNLGKFIGEEPASSYYCNDMSRRLQLPNTKLEVNIPQKTFRTRVSGYEYDQHFPLDYPVNMEVKDIVAKIDTQWEFVLNLIESVYN